MRNKGVTQKIMDRVKGKKKPPRAENVPPATFPNAYELEALLAKSLKPGVPET